jgi:hypothetical protein
MKHTSVRSWVAGRSQRWLFVLLAMMSFIVAGPALAARINGGLGIPGPAPLLQPAPVPPQFDITGFIQDATLAPVGSMCPSVTDPRLMGGTVTLNGQKIIVPCNTILQMPAFAATWADLFTMAPADITPAGKIGLSLTEPFVPGTAGLLNSLPTGFNSPLPSHEIQVVGNVIKGQYIAGLIFISQQPLNAGQGIISCIDYATGELQVGGVIQPHGSPCTLPAPAGVARVRMNDPVGRYGIVHGGKGCLAAGTCDVEEAGYDPRFTADTDNPTMHSALGYPICIPAFNPTVTMDAKCPIYNRPTVPNCKGFDPLTGLPPFGAQAGVAGYCTTWVMDPPGSHTAAKPDATDPTLAAPLVIGDTIGFHGTLKADANGSYISAHTIDANLGIYTQPHTKPAYVFMEGVLVGTGGGPVGGLAVETTTKVSWVGFTTDPTELVDFFSLHQDPITGAVTEFYLQTYDPCCTPLGRFRSPANNIGAFGEPQRNYRAVSRNACQVDGVNGPTAPAVTAICHMDPLYAPDPTAKQATYTLSTDGKTGTGLVPSQYTLPVFEFIFAENLNFGTPLVPNNFQDIPFLFCGSGPIGGPGSGTTVVGQLVPAPWDLPMPDPIFASVLCPTATKVGAAPGGAPTPVLPQPAILTSVTATPPSTVVGRLTTVTLTANATDPNTPANLAYAWTFPAGVTMSCGACVTPNANWRSVTATFNPTAAGSLTFGARVTNGVTPAATGSVIVTVAPSTARAPNLRSFSANPTSPAAGGTLVTLTAVGNTNPTGGTVSFSFKQTGGPAVIVNGAVVPLGQPIPVTTTSGVAPADQTARATFTVPFVPTQANATFQVTVKDNATGLTTSSSTTSVTVRIPATPPDALAFLGGVVNYLDLGNVGGVTAQRGKLTISVTSSTGANPPAGMTMTATFFNNTLPANVPGSSALPMTAPLVFTAADPVGTTVAVCGPTPCWTTLVSGVIANTSVTPAILVAPTSVTVRSSLGGTVTATGAAIVIR